MTISNYKGKKTGAPKTEGDGLKIETDYIKLDSFLKAVNAVSSGGEAKIVIASGMVRVNGEAENRRGRKLYPGDRVIAAGKEYMVE